MEENNRTEEKELRRFYAENILRNVYGLKGDLSTLLSNFINSFYEHFFQNFDYEKAKHIRNAQSNLIGMSNPNKTDKVTFYVGLMDKDTLTYNYSIEESINKAFQIFGECTVFSCKGSFTNKYGKFIVMDSLQIVLYRKNVTNEYIHLKAKELKKFFNQDSILTEITNSARVELNDEPDSYDEEINKIMKEYDWSWDVAVQAYNSGLL